MGAHARTEAYVRVSVCVFVCVKERGYVCIKVRVCERDRG